MSMILVTNSRTHELTNPKKSRGFQQLRYTGWISIAFLLFLTSCQSNFDNLDGDLGPYFVTAEEAVSIIEDLSISINSDNSSLSQRTTIHPTIVELHEAPDDNGDNAYYIAELEQTGFIVLSADRRLTPVRAFSLTANFPSNEDPIPAALYSWLKKESSIVSELRDNDEPQTSSIESEWQVESIDEILAIIGGPSNPDGPDGPGVEDFNCNDSSTWPGLGPLLSTTWGQRGGYNDLAPDLGCTGDPRAPTGCVATAMAQLMKYHEHPTTYSWGAMPNSSGTNETAELMRDIGDAVDMNYQCSGSGAQMNDAKNVFMNTFDYTTAQLNSYSYSTVVSEIQAERPVILAGYTLGEDCWWIFCIDDLENGHAWVCDGTLIPPYCPEHPDYRHYLHMNWGWNGSFNGYFAA